MQQRPAQKEVKECESMLESALWLVISDYIRLIACEVEVIQSRTLKRNMNGKEERKS